MFFLSRLLAARKNQEFQEANKKRMKMFRRAYKKAGGKRASRTFRSALKTGWCRDGELIEPSLRKLREQANG